MLFKPVKIRIICAMAYSLDGLINLQFLHLSVFVFKSTLLCVFLQKYILCQFLTRVCVCVCVCVHVCDFCYCTSSNTSLCLWGASRKPNFISWKVNNQSINHQTSIAPISLAKPGLVVRQPNQCSTAKSRKQFRNINRPWGVTVCMGERPSQRDMS